MNMCVCMFFFHTSLYVCMYDCVCMNVYVCMFVCMCVRLYLCNVLFYASNINFALL
jgi:hypothetical protein